MPTPRPHVLGIDDGPFEKAQPAPVPIVGVMMEGEDLVEAVAVTAFPVDGADVTTFLARWVKDLRMRPSLQAIVLGGITIAGLAVVDLWALAANAGCPVLSVTRGAPSDEPVLEALQSAGLAERAALVRAAPRAVHVNNGVHVAAAGADSDRAAALVRATLGKSHLPEPLRIAHLIGRALVLGESRGRA